MSLPSSWAEATSRLAHVLASVDDAAEWARQACEGRLVTRQSRALAFQKFSGVVLALEERDGDLAFDHDAREIVSAAFARYFGKAPAGPPWRIQPHEPLPDRTSMSDDFAEPESFADQLQRLLTTIEKRREQRAAKGKCLPPGGLGVEGV